MISRESERVDATAAGSATEIMQRRLSGESVARIVGEKEFYGLPFALSSATLEPRPETELLVDLALQRLRPGGRLLDLGTGTGCIPIAILANRPDAHALATDINSKAIEMAARNAERHGLAGRLTFAQGSWFEALPVPALFDLIVSNPPYIATAVLEALAPEVKDFDPHLALDGGADGLAPYRIIAAGAPQLLVPGGLVLVEIGHDQGAAVQTLFRDAGFEEVAVHKDLAGLDRVVSAHQIEVTSSKW
jgi:release factor glutamine methyltransferase